MRGKEWQGERKKTQSHGEVRVSGKRQERIKHVHSEWICIAANVLLNGLGAGVWSRSGLCWWVRLMYDSCCSVITGLLQLSSPFIPVCWKTDRTRRLSWDTGNPLFFFFTRRLRPITLQCQRGERHSRWRQTGSDDLSPSRSVLNGFHSSNSGITFPDLLESNRTFPENKYELTLTPRQTQFMPRR